VQFLSKALRAAHISLYKLHLLALHGFAEYFLKHWRASLRAARSRA
jgi:hypothetical protein